MSLVTWLLVDAVEKGGPGSGPHGGSGGIKPHAGGNKFEAKSPINGEDENGDHVSIKSGAALTLHPDSISDKSAEFHTSSGDKVSIQHGDAGKLAPRDWGK